jgi:serine/threonine protein kinase
VEEQPRPPVIDCCPACGGQIDVTDEVPFAQIYCPHCGESVRARRMFNNFELVEVIGEGGMGSVFKAYDHTLGRMVALKVLKREMSAREDERVKLEQEARITASVNHPHVVSVYSFGEADGQFYLAMELVEKGSLDDLMGIQTRVSEAQVLEIGMQIAQGLEAAAEKGLIHRDVKPGNILFADAHTAKIVDFGLARVLEEEAEAHGEIWGTPYYIAPERLNHEAEDFRSDIYSLGATLFHAIAGRPPFEAESASLVALKQIKSQPVSLEAFAPDVAAETAYVINRMLEKKPEDRYGDYGELVEHLEFARAKVLETSGRPREARQREVVKVETGRMKLYVALITLCAAVLLLGAGAWLFLTSERSGVKSLREGLSGAGRSGQASLSLGYRALAAGQWSEARELFQSAVRASASGSTSEQWAKVNLAVSLVLEGRRDQAREQWRALSGGGLYSDREADLDRANLFLYAAEFGLRDTPVRAGELTKYPQSGVGALVYFFAGLANYNVGDRAEAAELFAKFLALPVDKGVAPWGAYRAVAEKLSAAQ